MSCYLRFRSLFQADLRWKVTLSKEKMASQLLCALEGDEL